MNELEKKVLSRIDSASDKLYGLLSRLIRVATCNYNTNGDEARLAPLILNEYKKLGLEAKSYYPADVPHITENPDFLPGRGAENRPNFSGIYTAKNASKTIMLASHTDVMPTGSLEQWSVDPFGGIDKEGRIYGRGANDNKFGIASSIMAFDAICQCGIELENNVILEAYCDEEYGGGNGALASSLLYRPDAIINTDGGNYEIWSCSLGGQVVKIGLRANLPQDSSALIVDALCIVREELGPFIENRHNELEKDRYYAGTDMSRSAFRFYEFSAGKGDLGCNLELGTLSFVFYTNKSRETIERELSQIEMRLSDRLKQMNVHAEGFKPLTRFFHSLSLPDDDETLIIAKQAAQDASGRKVRISGSCLTDLSLFMKYGSKHSLNFGLVRDFSLYGGAHQPDEFVEKQALLEHCRALALLLMRWCGSHEVKI